MEPLPGSRADAGLHGPGKERDLASHRPEIAPLPWKGAFQVRLCLPGCGRGAKGQVEIAPAARSERPDLVIHDLVELLPAPVDDPPEQGLPRLLPERFVARHDRIREDGELTPGMVRDLPPGEFDDRV